MDNSLRQFLPDPPTNALGVVAQDATRFAPPVQLLPQQAPPSMQQQRDQQPVPGISAAPDDWFSRLKRGAGRWQREHGMADISEFPPIKALRAVLGSHPMESIGGSKAISAFAARNPQVMRRFADPGFHNWMIKHGPKKGYFSQVRDWAPETVIDDLWAQYQQSPSGKFGAARGAARKTAEAAREQASSLHRRTGDTAPLAAAGVARKAAPADRLPGPERVTLVSLRLPDGRVVAGPGTHGDVLAQHMPGATQKEISEVLRWLDHTPDASLFRTSHGRDVSRTEATKLAKKAKQLNNDRRGIRELDSWDIDDLGDEVGNTLMPDGFTLIKAKKPR
jgi:hypothetical protein